MLKSSVRLALLTSVTCARPPVSRQIRNESTVPKSTSPRSALARRPGIVSSMCLSLVPEKYGSSTSPVFSRNIASRPAAFSASQIGALTRLCQTIALCHRLARDAVPHDRGLALVGNADRGDVCGRQPRLGESLARDSQLRRPDGFGIVLDLAGLRKDLFELLLRDRHDRAVPPEDNRAAGGRSLIEREHETAHDSATCWSVPAEVGPGGGVTGASGGW